MRSYKGVVLAGAALLGFGIAPAHAGWHNVFQVCCHGCGTPSVSSNFIAFSAPAACCPQPVCTTQYVQRSYYQPVTTYQTRTYYEPVTTYQTSYFYEPVCSYRYSCYFDPCTCSFRQVATPVTSYRLRSQCNAVTSYVQRCCLVPVTTYQQVSYFEPVTTCSNPCPPDPCATATPGTATPGTGDTRIPPQPGIEEYRGSQPNQQQQYDRYYGPREQTPPPPTAPGNTHRQLLPHQRPVSPAATPPPVRLDRVTSVARSRIDGLLVRSDHQPWSGAHVLFVNAEKRTDQPRTVTADPAGRFSLSLASGSYFVYVPGNDGRPLLHSKIEVRDSEARQLKLIGR